jgi:hypothetical protein
MLPKLSLHKTSAIIKEAPTKSQHTKTILSFIIHKNVLWFNYLSFCLLSFTSSFWCLENDRYVYIHTINLNNRRTYLWVTLVLVISKTLNNK